jgi:hypothetical protein
MGCSATAEEPSKDKLHPFQPSNREGHEENHFVSFAVKESALFLDKQ